MSERVRHGRLLFIFMLVLAGANAFPALAEALQSSVVGAPSSSWQTNGTVWALAYASGKVYVGGDFTRVRPPGAAPGSDEVVRNHLAVFDSATGALLPADPNLDGIVWALAASPDGRTVYAGGDFVTAGGEAVRRLAAYDTSSDARIAGWQAKASSSVRSLEAANGRVYIGGMFSQMDNEPRTRLAAVDPATGALDPWAPSADTAPLAISAARDGSKIYVGGRFTSVNGAPQHAIAALDPTTGATLSFPAATAMPPVTSSCTSSVKDLTTDATTLYVAAEGNGGGCFDGTFAANVSDGSLKWKNACLGATQSVEVVGNYLYKGSHAHDCSSVPGGFPETGSGGKFHLLAENLGDGLLGPWYPSTNGDPLGPRVFATDGRQLFVGGDFTYVNSRPQQGFTRFDAAPDTTPPVRPATPRVSSDEPGSVRIIVTGTWDRDDNDLTYTLTRDTVPIKTWTMTSKPWSLPTIVQHDDGLVPGSTHVYKVVARDGTNSGWSFASAAVTVAGSPGAYVDDVKADFPSLYWRLGETSGTTAFDASGNNVNGIYGGGAIKGQRGAISSSTDTAVLFDGATGRVSSATAGPAPQRFSIEAWFKSTTRAGGKIVGFGNSQTGTSSSYDRHVYMTSSGQLIFGVLAGTFPTLTQTITSAPSYNDGNWHHLVATMGPSGMALYVDATLVGTNPNPIGSVYNGYWRVGGDNLAGWPSRPVSGFFSGTLDEVAVYDYALDAGQVAHHYGLR